MDSLVGEKRYPKITLDYILKGEDRESCVDFKLAGEEYSETRPEIETVTIEVKTSDEKYDFVTYGRKVIEAMSYADIDHQIDVMQDDIEARLNKVGLNEVVIKSRAGRSITGNLPDKE